MRNMLNIERTRDLRVGESYTPRRKYTLKGVLTAMTRKIENNISRVQLWLQVAMTVFTISCVVLPWAYNQLVEKGREQQRMESLIKEVQDLKKVQPAATEVKPADTTREETVVPKPKPRRGQQVTRTGKPRINGKADPAESLANTYANMNLPR